MSALRYARSAIGHTGAVGAIEWRYSMRLARVARVWRGNAMTNPAVKLGWKQRVVERSIKAARFRAEQRAEQLLEAAQALLVEKGTTDFTVQEIIDRSGQSTRSFYEHFDGKQELLLALLEQAKGWPASHIRAVTASHNHPLDRLKLAVQMLFDLCRRGPAVRPPLFAGSAPWLLTADPAYASLLALLTEFIEAASAEGHLRTDKDPARVATLALRAIVFIARCNVDRASTVTRPITADDVWDFCAHALGATN
jgi:AcrR family transcriptional regulator